MGDPYEDIMREEASSIPGAMAEPDAFYMILYSAVCADGNLDEREKKELEALISRSRTLSKAFEDRQRDFSDLKAKVQSGFEGLSVKDKRERALEQAKSAAQPLRAKPEIARSVFMHAVDIIFSDLEFPESERRFVTELGKALGITEEDFRIIIKYLRYKNQL